MDEDKGSTTESSERGQGTVRGRVILEPCFHPSDSQWQIRGNTDGLKILAASALRAIESGDTPIDISEIARTNDDMYLLNIVHAIDEKLEPDEKVNENSFGWLGSLIALSLLLLVLVGAYTVFDTFFSG